MQQPIASVVVKLGSDYPTFVETKFLRPVAQTTVGFDPERPYVALALKIGAYDTSIRTELPGTHLSTFEDIAGLAKAQCDGQSGFLLSNGHMNIFHVQGENDEVIVATVLWRSVHRHYWRIRHYCARRWGEESYKGGYWLPGCQVIVLGHAAL